MPPKPITDNTLFYGDTLDMLREYIPSESVGIVYFDLPFNSNRNHNVLFTHGMFKQAQRVTTAAGEQLGFEVK